MAGPSVCQQNSRHSLDEIGATGWGIRHATEIALGYQNFDLKNATVVVQGFGSVGKHAARFLFEQGAKLIAAMTVAALSITRRPGYPALFKLKR